MEISKMKIKDDFIQGNDRIKILSNRGKPTAIPPEWQPVLDSCSILIVIPDMHMYIHGENLDNFSYGADAMLHFLSHCGKLKKKLARNGKTLRLYQTGDIYELRFPSKSPTGSNVGPGEITLSDSSYGKIVNTLDSLRTHYIYGNHDFELRHYLGYKFFANEGKVHLEHGFAADKWSDFSNPKAPLWEPGQFLFKTAREIEMILSKLLVATSIIQPDEHFAIGVKSGKTERGNYPSPSTYATKHPNQSKYYEKRLKTNKDGAKTKICIIAHTHQPYLNANVDGGKYILADAGAWTEGRSDFAVVTNEEIAVCRYKRK